MSHTDWNLVALPLAYLDPGTGAMILQVIAAGVAGAVVFCKYQGRRFLRFLHIGSKNDAGDDGGTG